MAERKSNYVVKLDRGCGHAETVFGPTCEDDCLCFIAGWEKGRMESGIIEVVACWELFIEEVYA